MNEAADNTVFISYRRSVGAYIARAIYEDLNDHDFDVFMDVESIDSGKFDQIILNQISARTHFVLVLSPGSVERCAEPDDWLRREIETAMSLERNIVPVLADGFDFPGTEAYLTGKLSQLERFNSVKVYSDYFEEAMERLRERFLKNPTPSAMTRADDEKTERHRHRQALPKARARSTTEFLLSPEIHVARAVMRERTGDAAGALKEYENALTLNKDMVEAYHGRARLYKNLGSHSKAMVDFNRAIRINPRDAAMYDGRGQVAFAMALYGQCLSDFQKAHELNPGAMQLLAGLAIVHHAFGQEEGAYKLWTLLTNTEQRFEKPDWLAHQFQWPQAMLDEAALILKERT